MILIISYYITKFIVTKILNNFPSIRIPNIGITCFHSQYTYELQLPILKWKRNEVELKGGV